MESRGLIEQNRLKSNEVDEYRTALEKLREELAEAKLASCQ